MSVRDPRAARGPSASFWTPGEGLAWVASVILTLGAFMGWYSGSEDGIVLSAIGWHTGLAGKLVLLAGLAAVALLVLRATGFELPPNVPVGMILTFFGAIGTVCVLVRVIQIPDDYAGFGRSVGLWISLVAGFLLIAAGLVKASEELAARA
jgi:hypothetical protein